MQVYRLDVLDVDTCLSVVSRPQPEDVAVLGWCKASKQSDEERRQLSQVYERKQRKRKWNDKWKFGDDNTPRDWLQYNEANNHMFCAHCRQYATSDAHRKGPFFVGTQTFKLESIKPHEKSEGHRCCASIAAAKRTPPNTTAAERALCHVEVWSV